MIKECLLFNMALAHEQHSHVLPCSSPTKQSLKFHIRHDSLNISIAANIIVLPLRPSHVFPSLFQ
jgi:hypothetical protein